MDRGTVDTPVYDQVRDVDPFRPELARGLCAVARSPALAAAPVNRMVPRPRSSMWRAASRPVTNPAKQASCQTRWNSMPEVSSAPARVLAPALNRQASSGPTSRSMVSNRATTAPSSGRQC